MLVVLDYSYATYTTHGCVVLLVCVGVNESCWSYKYVYFCDRDVYVWELLCEVILDACDKDEHPQEII